jgi:hypothetical protein
MNKETLDITKSYYLSKSNGNSIKLDKDYRVLNLLNLEDRKIAITYAFKIGSILYKDLVNYINKLDYNLPSRSQRTTYNCYESKETEPKMPKLTNDKGLYGKYIVTDLDRNPIQFPAFVISMKDPIVLQIIKLEALPL